MCVSIILQLSSEIFLILRRNRPDIVINLCRFACKVSVILIIWTTFYFFWYIFENIKYEVSWKTVQWEPSCWMGTDRYDEANCRFSQNYLCIHFVQCCQDSRAITYRCAEYKHFTTKTRLDRNYYLAWNKRVFTDKLAINQLLKKSPPFFSFIDTDIHYHVHNSSPTDPTRIN